MKSNRKAFISEQMAGGNQTQLTGAYETAHHDQTLIKSLIQCIDGLDYLLKGWFTPITKTYFLFFFATTIYSIIWIEEKMIAFFYGHNIRRYLTYFFRLFTHSKQNNNNKKRLKCCILK